MAGHSELSVRYRTQLSSYRPTKRTLVYRDWCTSSVALLHLCTTSGGEGVSAMWIAIMSWASWQTTSFGDLAVEYWGDIVRIHPHPLDTLQRKITAQFLHQRSTVGVNGCWVSRASRTGGVQVVKPLTWLIYCGRATMQVTVLLPIAARILNTSGTPDKHCHVWCPSAARCLRPFRSEATRVLQGCPW